MHRVFIEAPRIEAVKRAGQLSTLPVPFGIPDSFRGSVDARWETSHSRWVTQARTLDGRATQLPPGLQHQFMAPGVLQDQFDMKNVKRTSTQEKIASDMMRRGGASSRLQVSFIVVFA